MRRLLRNARIALDTGMWRQPTDQLLKLIRHRQKLGQVSKALFYHRFATALFLAVELGVFHQLQNSKATADDLAKQCQVHPEAMRTLLLILESQGWVQREGGHIRLSKFGVDFFEAQGPSAGRHMLELMSAQAKAFPDVLTSMRTGITPPSLEVRNLEGPYPAFLTAVNNYLFWVGREFLKKADLPPIRRFIVGSMGVSFSALVLDHSPESTVTYGCLEHLVREIPRLRKEFDVEPSRVDDMHAHSGAPEEDHWGGTFDLVFLTRKMILEPSEQIGEKFARKAYEVLNEDGVAVFWETVYSEDGPICLPRGMEAVFDLCTSPSAPARSADDYRHLFQGIGFSSVQLVSCLGGQTTFLVARK